MKVGIIGCGHAGAIHVEAIRKSGNICVGAWDVDSEKAANFATRHTLPHTFGRRWEDEMDIDLMAICTPPSSHAAVAKAVMESGLDVLIEKPLALSSADSEVILNCREKHGVRAYVCAQHRLSPPIAAVQQALERDAFGSLQLITGTLLWCRPASYFEKTQWRGTTEHDGGIFWSQANHLVDLLVYFRGGELVTAVTDLWSATPLEGKNAPDSGIAMLEYATGVRANLVATTCARPHNLECSIRVLGSAGSAIIGGKNLNHVLAWSPVDGSLPPPAADSRTHHLVYQAIQDKRARWIDASEGDLTVKLTEVIMAGDLNNGI